MIISKKRKYKIKKTRKKEPRRAKRKKMTKRRRGNLSINPKKSLAFINSNKKPRNKNLKML